MLRNSLLALLLLVGVLIITDRARRPRPIAPLVAVQTVREIPPAPCCAAQRPAVTAPENGLVPPTATPALDLVARLAIRRRIVREGNAVYLDSLFAHTDSVLTHWYERKTLAVQLLPDTSLALWTPALLDEARAGMRAWNALGVSPVLNETEAGDSADIVVHWVNTLSDTGQVGVTSLTWGADGAVTHATVTLALRHNRDSLPLSPPARARVAIHELGHALGLPHSDDSDDIMFRTSPVSAPSNRDQATLRLLYVLFPGSLRVQP